MKFFLPQLHQNRMRADKFGDSCKKQVYGIQQLLMNEIEQIKKQSNKFVLPFTSVENS